MPSQIELFGQMTIILDRLLENATKMKEALNLKYSPTDLEAMQNYQHEILAELGQLNALLDKSPPGGSVAEIDECKAQIRERLSLFQIINHEFFDQINTHTRVIKKKNKQ